MDDMSSAALLTALAIAMGGFLLLARGLGSKQDPREPPFVAASIPYIGHIIGLMRSNFNYYVQLRYTQFRDTTWGRLLTAYVASRASSLYLR